MSFFFPDLKEKAASLNKSVGEEYLDFRHHNYEAMKKVRVRLMNRHFMVAVSLAFLTELMGCVYE